LTFQHARLTPAQSAAAKAGASFVDVMPPVDVEPVAKKRRAKPEFVLQCGAVKQLRTILPLDYLVVSHCAERDSFTQGRFAKMQGQVAGFPDTQILGDGRSWFLEWKAKNGRLSPAQKDMHARLREARQRVAVCYSIEQAVAFLKSYGCRFRGSLS
jgi:hypothetical protein